MAFDLIQTESDVTNEIIEYVTWEAKSMSNWTEEDLLSYCDRELSNPQVKKYLRGANFLDAVTGEDPTHLTFIEETRASNIFKDVWNWFFPRFKKAKRQIRIIICQVLNSLSGDSSINLATIIKGVLLALIPAFVGGVPGILLPIIIALIMLALKQGKERFCAI